MNIEKLNELLSKKKITIKNFRDHSKASEKYVDVKFENDNFVWEGSVPYFYRRTGLFISNEKDLSDYLLKINKYFSKKNMEIFKKNERTYWENEMSGKKTTKEFFDCLIKLTWCSVKADFPSNPNWARRIQDIKDFGYTLATHTNMQNQFRKDIKGTHILLLPIPRGGGIGYEVMSSAFKNRAIKALNSINIFELSSAGKHGLIPDHKFPEIRWDKKTKVNNESLDSEEIKGKFQLLDNQRNQQKREVCRACFQTNKRGTIFGINYFYEGNSFWDSKIPKMGKNAEKGCFGCAWYDLEKWRKSLNEKIINS